MSLKKLVLALVLTSATALGWLALPAAPAASAAPAPAQTELKNLNRELGLHAKKQGKKHHHKKGKKHHHKKPA